MYVNINPIHVHIHKAAPAMKIMISVDFTCGQGELREEL